MNVAIIAFEGINELDVVGPFEVLRRAARLSPNFAVNLYSSDDRSSVTGQMGLTVSTEGPLEYRPDPELTLRCG